MKRRLYVVEYRFDDDWIPNGRTATAYASLAKKLAAAVRVRDVRVVAYGPHGERVSARPLLVLRAKGWRR